MRAFIERIDSAIATVKLGEQESITLYLPVSWLPPGAREGTVLKLHWEIDHESTKTAHAEVQELLDALRKEP
jgi:hypothetical protein